MPVVYCSGGVAVGGGGTQANYAKSLTGGIGIGGSPSVI
jgi:hypothetical protein